MFLKCTLEKGLGGFQHVRAYVINEMVTIEFVKSNENISDIMTKNQQLSNYHNAQVNLVYTVKEMNGEEHET